MKTYEKELTKLSSEKLKEFSKKLIPNLQEEMLGCTNPSIKALAKEVVKNNDYDDFLNALPHKYHEENILHGYILSLLKISQNELIILINDFLPYVSNWAVCDTMVRGSKAFVSDLNTLFNKSIEWINAPSTYHKRFGIITLMSYFLRDEYISQVLETLKNIKSDEYYINMAIAWSLATALINFEDQVVELLKTRELNTFTHNKTIQKAIESFRIKKETKEYLKTLKVQKKGEEEK